MKKILLNVELKLFGGEGTFIQQTKGEYQRRKKLAKGDGFSLFSTIDPINVLKPNLIMRILYVAYKGTYVPTEFKGRIGVINE